MKRFRFRFETVERVRKAKEQEALKALGVAQQGYAATISYKNSIIAKMNERLKRREEIGEKLEASILDVQLETDFIEGSRHRIRLSDQAILRAKRNVEKALRSYLFARRQLRMIESLREKAFLEFKQAANKREQKQIDEMNTLRARLHDRRISVIDEESNQEERLA